MAKAKTRKQKQTTFNTYVTVGSQEAAVEAEPTQAQLELAKAKEIIEPMAKAGKSDNEMAVALIQVGDFAFKKAGRLLRRCLEDLGVRMSAKDRLTQVSELLLSQDFEPKEWSEVTKVCEWLSEELDATDEKQAMKAVKKFAEAQGIELPKKPKGGGSRKTGFRTTFYAWVIANPAATDAEFQAWVKPYDKRKGLVNALSRILGVAREVHANASK